jgi:uncharacterized protein (TIGR02300 family)
MAKAEWGTKRTCPKCSKRFYDLGKFDLSKNKPLVCIECGHEWKHEPILKTKQLHVVPEAKKAVVEKSEEDIFLEADDDDATPANNDDDVTVETLNDDDEDVATIVDAPIEKPATE